MLDSVLVEGAKPISYSRRIPTSRRRSLGQRFLLDRYFIILSDLPVIIYICNYASTFLTCNYHSLLDLSLNWESLFIYVIMPCTIWLLTESNYFIYVITLFFSSIVPHPHRAHTRFTIPLTYWHNLPSVNSTMCLLMIHPQVHCK